jgi:hypothetical protein
MIEDALLDILYIADIAKPPVFAFKSSPGQYVSLSKSIDNVDSFLLTNDDIIGQMERCDISKIVDGIKAIKTRKVKKIIMEENDHRRTAHYGMGHSNPLKFVKFVDKYGLYRQIDNDIIESMCPRKFFIDI